MPHDEPTAATAFESDVAPERHATLVPAEPGARYVDRLVLGRGGMGIVWLSHDRVLDCAVVRKVMRDASVPEDRFVSEARITARLQHPGIVPVHDLGRLADGRLYYTMRQVHGEGLDRAIAALHRDGVGSLRPLVDVVRRVADTMAYVHDQGIVHRDLKPSNLMVGAFGAVQVVDWGLAMEAGSAVGSGGTPGYRAPERDGPLHPAVDVYALGAVLHCVLFGHPQRRRPGAAPPATLVALCTAALDPDPSRRPTAAAFAADIGAWQDGLQRRARALALVDEADALVTGIDACHARADALRAEASAVLAALDTGAPVSDKEPAWAALDAAEEAARDAEQHTVERVRLLHAALREHPELPEAHARLADHHHARHAAAEARRDALAAVRHEARLREHDRGRYAAWLQGDGAVTLVTEPPAEVWLARYVTRGRRLVREPVSRLGHTPLVEHTLPRGSWVLELRAAGHHPVLYPVCVGRLEHWHGVRPGDTAPCPVVLPRLGDLGPDDVYVPAGWAPLGGDAGALDPLPAGRRWVDGFVLRRHPLTHGAVLGLLNALVAAGDVQGALAMAPRRRPGLGEAVLSYRFDGTRFSLDADGPDGHWQADWPAVELDWHAAVALAARIGERDGLPWRLPHELEWEKAARGVDGRTFPWGDHLEPAWARILDAQRGRPAPCAVGHPPEDRSPYGVQGLVGNVRDWCLNAWAQPALTDGSAVVPIRVPAADDERHRSTRGGVFSSNASLCRPATRTGARPGSRFAAVGVRLARGLRG